MSKKPRKRTKGPPTAQTAASSTSMPKIPAGSESQIQQLGELVWRHDGMTEDELSLRVRRAVQHFLRIAPNDGLELILAEQMVATHLAAMEGMRRAALPNQTTLGTDMSLKHAQKLMALSVRQIEALNKHRGKGQQKVTVEHISVEKGGQAIVGNVETGGRSKVETRSAELEHRPDTSVPLQSPEEKQEKEARKLR